MSEIFGPFCKLQTALPLNIGLGVVVKSEVEWLGTNMDDSGRIYAILNTQIDHHANGLPFNVHGRLCVSGALPDYVSQGVPFSATNHVSIGSGPVAYSDQGTPFNADGQIVFVETPNP